MIRKSYIIGIMTLGLAASAQHGAPMVDRVISSARSFHHHFHDLKTASELSTIERFVFSLVLADTKAPRAEMNCPPPPDRRT